jgi:HEPN domain-containing protein
MAKKKAEAERWFKQASSDLKAAAWNIKGDFHFAACFLAQQSAEKALKSLLYYLGASRSTLFTHSLVVLVQEGQKQLDALAALLSVARELDLHYLPSRYPDSLPGSYPHKLYSKDVAERAVENAETILAFVEDYYRDQGQQAIIGDEDA